MRCQGFSPRGGGRGNSTEVTLSNAIRLLKVSKLETDSCHRQQSKLIERLNGISVIIPEVEIDVFSIMYVHDVEVDGKAIPAQLTIIAELQIKPIIGGIAALIQTPVIEKRMTAKK